MKESMPAPEPARVEVGSTEPDIATALDLVASRTSRLAHIAKAAALGAAAIAITARIALWWLGSRGSGTR